MMPTAVLTCVCARRLNALTPVFVSDGYRAGVLNLYRSAVDRILPLATIHLR
jgi:hypothetical protein